MSHRPLEPQTRTSCLQVVIAALVSSRNPQQCAEMGQSAVKPAAATPANESPCDVAGAPGEAPPLPAFRNVLKRIERDKCSEHRTKCSVSVSLSFFFLEFFILFKICCNAANKLIAQLGGTKLGAISGNSGATEVQLSREFD